ncbi:MAG: helix-turn-helix transcriptional regulator [Dehalococcoidia bacterium]|nr:helix-turn-helix transcriptional regulator [Dehalococcoidia bacterium]
MSPIFGLKLLTPTRQMLLVALKRRQRATADLLAEECYLSVGAVRQHLTALALQGLLDYEEERHGPGRPRHVYSLTPRGESLFPQQSSQVANAILTALGDEDQEVRARFLARLAEIQHQRMAERLRNTTGKERLDEFVAAAEEYGHLPSLEPEEDGWRIDSLHCPIYDVASRHQELCEAELACMRESLPGFHIERVSHRPAGDNYCSYRLRHAASDEEPLADPSGAG